MGGTQPCERRNLPAILGYCALPVRRIPEEPRRLITVGDLRGHHLFPFLVAVGDPLQDVAREDRQILRDCSYPAARNVRVQRDSRRAGAAGAATSRFSTVVSSFVSVGPQRIDEELEIVLEQPTEALENAARQVRCNTSRRKARCRLAAPMTMPMRSLVCRAR